MERMENSIQELIAALQPSPMAQPQPPSSSAYPQPAQHAPGQIEEADTDEDYDNTRQTAAGTDVSEERINVTRYH